MLRSRTKTLVIAAVLGLTLTACGGLDATTLRDDGTRASAGTVSSDSSDVADKQRDLIAGDVIHLSEMMARAQESYATVHLESSMDGEGLENEGLSAIVQSGDVVLGASSADRRIDMTMEIMDEPIEMILVDSTMYMDLGEFGVGEGALLSLPLDDLAEEPGLLRALDLVVGADPALQIRQLSEAVIGFEYDGPEVIDGIELDVYRATLDPRRVSDPAPLVMGDAELAHVSAAPIYMVFRIDADNLPVAIDTVSEAAGHKTVKATRYSDWGKNVSIEAPPAEQVIPFDEVVAEWNG